MYSMSYLTLPVYLPPTYCATIQSAVTIPGML